MAPEPALSALFPAAECSMFCSIAAAADLSGDGISDFITEELVAISRGPLAWEQRPLAIFGPAISADAGDFNGDGDLDFVLASIAERGLTST